jgi:hypothetical protein
VAIAAVHIRWVEIKSGFYYFVAYCLVSLLALQFMTVPASRAGVGVEEGS